MGQSKESDASRYLRSTISNIAFLGAIGYFVHEKALSETSLVTIMTLFIGGYFGVRAYQHRTDADTAASNSRFQIPNYRTPQDRDPPENPPTAPDTGTNPTRRLNEPIPRVDDPQGGRGRYKRLAVWLYQSGLAPIAIMAGICIVWILLYAALGILNDMIGLKAAIAGG